MDSFLLQDLSFLPQNEAEMLIDATNALQPEDWAKLKEFEPGTNGFMFCDTPDWLGLVYSRFQYSHSGASHALTMRRMHFISKYGFARFKQLFVLCDLFEYIEK